MFLGILIGSCRHIHILINITQLSSGKYKNQSREKEYKDHRGVIVYDKDEPNGSGAGGYTIFVQMEHAFVQGKHTMCTYHVKNSE